MVGRVMSVGEVVEELEKDTLFYDESGGGITISGGEPLAQPDFLLGLLKACGESGFHRAVDTTGLTDPSTLIQVAKETDLFLYDLKLMDPELHRQFTGFSNERILSNLQLLTKMGIKIVIRYPVIPSVNDDLENARLTAEFVCSLDGVPDVNILPFHKAARDKHKRFGLDYTLDESTEASDEQIARIRAVMEKSGLKVRIGG
jgi:pyruvate formate lyase activating enzyme